MVQEKKEEKKGREGGRVHGKGRGEPLSPWRGVAYHSFFSQMVQRRTASFVQSVARRSLPPMTMCSPSEKYDKELFRRCR